MSYLKYAKVAAVFKLMDVLIRLDIIDEDEFDFRKRDIVAKSMANTHGKH